jgi:hypothetical protein
VALILGVAMVATAVGYYATRPAPEPSLIASLIPPPGVFADT